MTPLLRSIVLVLLVSTTGFGCAGDDVNRPAPADVTWYRDVAPLVTARCGGCHQPTGIAPMSLLTYDDALPHAADMASLVADHRMPPLPPEQSSCRRLDDARNMSDDERALLARWVELGAPAGDPAAPARTVAPGGGPPPLGLPSAVFDPGIDYASTYPDEDEYRCFVVDPHFAANQSLVAIDAGFTNSRIVHHTIVYAVLPAQVPAVLALDAADPLPGYTCFGGAGVPIAYPLSVGVPGSEPRAFPAQTGIILPPGTQFVVQMHYNFLGGRGADHPTVRLWQPAGALTAYPHGVGLANYTFFIPAGARDATAQASVPIIDGPADGVTAGRAGMAWDLFAHMHMIGRAIRIDLVHAQGGEECLLDIPDWDFHWQGFYRLAEPIALHGGDRLLVTCHWDNSPEHQPEIAGMQGPPHDITFGEGSRDEMCAAAVMMTDLE
jgi:hypothetical protein